MAAPAPSSNPPQAIASPEQLAAEAKALDAMGLRIITVVAEPLPADRWPQRRKNGEIVKDKGGNPRPAYCGKNPSMWRRDGEPQLLSHATPQNVPTALEAIRMAAAIGKPLGLAIIPSTEAVCIDFDAKNYDG